MDSEDLTVVADRGYFKGEEILARDEAGITTFLPKRRPRVVSLKVFLAKETFTTYLESTAFSPIRRDAKARSVWGRGGRGGIS